MKIKEKDDVPIQLGTPNSPMYLNGIPASIGWDKVTYPTSYREDFPVGATRPPLIDYYQAALSKLFATVSIPSWEGKARIEYDIDPKRKKMNYCYHTWNSCVNLPLSMKLGKLNTPKYIDVYPLYRFAMSGTPRGDRYYVPDVDRRNRSSRAWWTMQPKFESGFNATNFLIESADFMPLLRKFKDLINLNFFKVQRSFYKARNRSPLQAFNDVTGASASIWLSLKLQWGPLLADLANFADALMHQVEAAQNLFAAEGEYGTKSHYSENFNIADSTVGSSAGWTDVKSTGVYATSKFTATMSFKYDYDMRSPIEAFVKYWKLGGSFDTLWEATRLSFVFDYFVQIGKAIHAMELDENVRNVNVLKYCESYKSTEKSGIFIDAAGTPRLRESLISGVPFEGRELVSGYEAGFYTREPGSAYKGLYIPICKKPSTTQGATMLALVRSFMS